MGFANRAVNQDALVRSQGDVNGALEIILNELSWRAR